MQIDISATAVIGGKMEDHTHAVHRPLGHPLFPQISFNELDPAGLYVVGDVLGLSATQIVNHTHSCPPRGERIYKVRANEGGASGYKDFAILPVHSFLRIV
jgi:hypothetical protein